MPSSAPVSHTKRISSRSATGPRPVPSDRRNRARLRELCDEVLASFRVASNRELIPERDRVAGRELLEQIVPLSIAG